MRSSVIPFFISVLASCSPTGPLLDGTLATASLVVKGPPLFDFGSLAVEAGVEAPFILTNVGSAPATQLQSTFSLSLHFSFSGVGFPGTRGDCKNRLLPGESCVVEVMFSPRYVGQFEDSLKVTYNDGQKLQSTNSPLIRGRGEWGKPGFLDESFFSSGEKQAILGDQSDAISTLVMPDGKLLLVGTAVHEEQADFGLVRYQPQGQVDIGFADGGRKVFDLSLGQDDFVTAAQRQADGKVLIVGKTRTATGRWAMNLIRVQLTESTEFGTGAVSLDPSFGREGVVTLEDLQQDFIARALLVLPDRRIVVAGSVGPKEEQVWLQVFDSQGRVDETFGQQGRITRDLSLGKDVIHALAFFEGKIVAVGETNSGGFSNALVMRFLLNGSLDPTFGTAGVFEFDGGAQKNDLLRSVVIQSDGKIMVAGSVERIQKEFFLARLTSTGDWDSSFGNTGMTYLSFGNESDIGAFPSPAPNPDPVSPSNSGEGEAFALAIQADKKILVAGISGQALALARVNSQGALDPTFGNEGQMRSFLKGDQILANSIALQWNGKILITGRAVVGAEAGIFVARIWP